MPLNLKEAMMDEGRRGPNSDLMDPAEGVSTVGLPLYQKETKRQFL